MQKNTIVIDNGTGYTKMGFAGNLIPTFDIPTVIATNNSNKSKLQISKLSYQQLDFYIGQQAYKHRLTHLITNPVREGMVTDWNLMQKFWHRSFYDYMKVDPQQHYVVLTQPPLNSPQNRQHLAQIMFQTFGIKGLYTGVQAVLALISQNGLSNLTGTVLDSGDGVTHVIPVCDGFVIGSCIKSMPLAGAVITSFIGQTLKDRGEPITLEDQDKIAKIIKQKQGYIVEDGNLLEEFKKYDRKMNMGKKIFKKIDYYSQVKKQNIVIDVGYQKFIGPQIFFHPQFYNQKFEPVDQLIDKTIQACPIHTRRDLYKNIVLSGGSTLFQGFPKRLQDSIKTLANQRLLKYKLHDKLGKQINVKVSQNPDRRHVVWQGGSILANSPNFQSMIISRQDYMEQGSRIARGNISMI